MNIKAVETQNDDHHHGRKQINQFQTVFYFVGKGVDALISVDTLPEDKRKLQAQMTDYGKQFKVIDELKTGKVWIVGTMLGQHFLEGRAPRYIIVQRNNLEAFLNELNEKGISHGSSN